MAHSKEEIKYGTAQAKVSEDEALRVGYKHGTPLESGKVADSEPVQLFSGAQRIADIKASKGKEEKEENASSTSPP